MYLQNKKNAKWMYTKNIKNSYPLCAPQKIPPKTRNMDKILEITRLYRRGIMNDQELKK